MASDMGVRHRDAALQSADPSAHSIWRPYPAYKDSGVEWQGEIPAHWEVRRLKHLLRLQKGAIKTGPFGSQLQSAEMLAGDIKVYNQRNVLDRDFARGENYISLQKFYELRSFETFPGDLLITTRGSIGRCAVLPADAERGILHPCLMRIQADQRWISTRFLEILIQDSGIILDQLRLMSNATTIDVIYSESLREVSIVVPPPKDQDAIVAFLDRETTRIDALVAKNEQLIELLQEKRIALITQAVTKGLDPNVPMKDSGVEWLGQIPTHWNVERTKWIARMESGHTPDKKVESYWQGGDIPWISLADTQQLREVDYIADSAVRTTADGIAHSSAHILPAGTVVFSRDATIGLCAITRADMAVSQHFIGWVCTPRLMPEYLLFVLRSMTRELERLTMGATVRTIGMPDVSRLVTPIPPMREQEAIVDHVWKNRSQVDGLVSKIQIAIDRLKELRTALISAAVTGTIDTRSPRHSGESRNPGSEPA